MEESWWNSWFIMELKQWNSKSKSTQSEVGSPLYDKAFHSVQRRHFPVKRSWNERRSWGDRFSMALSCGVLLMNQLTACQAHGYQRERWWEFVFCDHQAWGVKWGSNEGRKGGWWWFHGVEVSDGIVFSRCLVWMADTPIRFSWVRGNLPEKKPKHLCTACDVFALGLKKQADWLHGTNQKWVPLATVTEMKNKGRMRAR